MLSLRDQMIQGACPMVMAPHDTPLPPIEIGNRRLIAASDGIYFQARSSAMNLIFKVAETRLPYGAVSQKIELRHGPLPQTLLNPFIQKARENPDCEIAAMVIATDAGYELIQPVATSASGSHISFVDDVNDDHLVLDIHSHARMPAFFSKTDDASDLSRVGPYIAMVVGECDKKMRSNLRAAISPYLLPIGNTDVFKLGIFAR